MPSRAGAGGRACGRNGNGMTRATHGGRDYIHVLGSIEEAGRIDGWAPASGPIDRLAPGRRGECVSPVMPGLVGRRGSCDPQPGRARMGQVKTCHTRFFSVRDVCVI